MTCLQQAGGILPATALKREFLRCLADGVEETMRIAAALDMPPTMRGRGHPPLSAQSFWRGYVLASHSDTEIRTKLFMQARAVVCWLNVEIDVCQRRLAFYRSVADSIDDAKSMSSRLTGFQVLLCQPLTDDAPRAGNRRNAGHH